MYKVTCIGIKCIKTKIKPNKDKIKCPSCNKDAEHDEMVWLEHEQTHVCPECHNAFLAFMESFRPMDEQVVSASEKRELEEL